VATVIKDGKKALRDLLAAASTLEIARPTPYYAIVQMDGDKMGFLLSGVEGEDEHRRISTTLSDFARQMVPKIVERQYPGRLVYAGGDDVLALVPLARDVQGDDQLKHVLDLVNRLQSTYCETVKGTLLPLVPQNKERVEGITASIGIAIAHHYTSLSYALRSAREAESLAKKRYGRNALVVTVLRRSGEQTRVGCHWHYPNLDADSQPIPLFSSFLTLFKENVLSPKCIHILLEEAPILVELDPCTQKSEIKRVFSRQLNEGKKSAEQEAHLKQLAEYVVDLAKAMDGGASDRASMEVTLHADTQRYGLVETLGWLLVMAFLARKDREQE
jgi:CRISPR-associated protein Cmr2